MRSCLLEFSILIEFSAISPLSELAAWHWILSSSSLFSLSFLAIFPILCVLHFFGLIISVMQTNPFHLTAVFASVPFIYRLPTVSPLSICQHSCAPQTPDIPRRWCTVLDFSPPVCRWPRVNWTRIRPTGYSLWTLAERPALQESHTGSLNVGHCNLRTATVGMLSVPYTEQLLDVSRVNRRKRHFSILNIFDPGILSFIEGSNINRPCNALTLTRDAHIYFGSFKISSEAVEWLGSTTLTESIHQTLSLWSTSAFRLLGRFFSHQIVLLIHPPHGCLPSIEQLLSYWT